MNFVVTIELRCVLHIHVEFIVNCVVCATRKKRCSAQDEMYEQTTFFFAHNFIIIAEL